MKNNASDTEATATPRQLIGQTTTTPPPRAFKWRAIAPLRHRDYRLLVGAVALSIFGSGIWTIVMVFQVLAIDSSPAALSLVAGCLSGGVVLFALVGGIAADRLPKRTLIICIQALELAAVSMVLIMAFTGTIQLWQMALSSLMLGAGAAFFYPSYSAYLPSILPAEELLAANGLEGALRPTLQQAIGPALGGLVVGAFFPAVGAVLVAALYAIALVLLLFVRPERRPVGSGPETAESTAAGETVAGLSANGQPGSPATEPKTSPLTDLREGIAFTLKTRWLFWTLAFACLETLIIMGPIEVLIPFIVKDSFENGEQTFGLLLAAYGLGGAIGSLAVSSWRLPRRYLTVMIVVWGIGTIPLILLGYTTSFWVMAAALFVVGLTGGAGMVIWGTLLQRRVPHSMLGRVASLDFFISIALMPLSIALVGPISAVLPHQVIFTAAGTIPVVLAVTVLFAGRLRADEIANPLTDRPDP